MMKSYNRFSPSQTFGVINNGSHGSVVYDFSGNLALSASVSGSLSLWNIRQAQMIGDIPCEQSNYPYRLPGEVSILEVNPFDKTSVAVGYSNGDLRIFDYINKSIVSTLRGHRSAITSLCFEKSVSSQSSMVLASGSADSDIVLWDLVSFTGLCKLRGHKDVVTGLAFLSRGSQNFLVSVSKDTLLKVWDIETQHCVQTVVGHRCEIWSLALSPSPLLKSGNDNSSISLLTGSSDEFIRGYRLKDRTGSNDEVSAVSAIGDSDEVLEYFGCVIRSTSGVNDKCRGLRFNQSGAVLAVQSGGKTVEMFKFRGDAETKNKYNRRLKRAREKAEKTATGQSVGISHGEYSRWEEPVADLKGEEETAVGPKLSDRMESTSTIRCQSKVRSFVFSPITGGSTHKTCKAMIGLVNNSLEIYNIPLGSVKGDEAQEEKSEKLSVIDLHGHRSDVRAVSVSGDGFSLATCSSEGVKTWSTRTHALTGSCKLDDSYCVSMVFAPGARYIIVGTKEGYLKILDTVSSKVIWNELAHEGGVVWSLAVRPDGQGFMSGGSDKLVKFWDFVLDNSAAGLGAVFARELQMSHDVLSLRYNNTNSTNKLMVAIGLLDSTVKVFYDDSLKFFLSLYGHKLPVMCLDISYDSNILVSGSADKTIKIWGLDFGDCHRSLIAHEDSVTCVRFQPHTHYFFSSGKDGVMKYWDADRFEQILFLPGHKGPIWGLGLTPDGFGVYSCGQDRSIRLWEKTDDLVFVEEERENAIEAEANQSAVSESGGGGQAVQAQTGSENDAQTEGGGGIAGTMDASDVAVTVRNLDSVKGGELLMDSLDLVEAEIAASMVEQSTNVETAGSSTLKNQNPLLLGLSPYKYMLRSLKAVKSGDMEQAMLFLPFHYVSRLVHMLIQLAKRGLEVELCTRYSIFLIRCFQTQIVSTHSLLREIENLQEILMHTIGAYRQIVGVNIAGLKYMKRLVDESTGEGLDIEEDPFKTGTSGQKKAPKKRSGFGYTDDAGSSGRNGGGSRERDRDSSEVVVIGGDDPKDKQKNKKHKVDKVTKKKQKK